MEGGFFTDALMAIASGLSIIGAAFYAHRKRDYLVAAWTLPLLWIAVFYAALAVNCEPLNSSADLRVVFYRPGMFFLLIFMGLHFFNGRVNNAIEKVHRQVTAWIRRFKP